MRVYNGVWVWFRATRSGVIGDTIRKGSDQEATPARARGHGGKARHPNRKGKLSNCMMTEGKSRASSLLNDNGHFTDEATNAAFALAIKGFSAGRI